MKSLALDATNKSLTAVMSAPKTTTEPDFTSTYGDLTSTPTFTPGSNDGPFNDTTPVTLVASPGASVQRIISGLTIQNRDSAAVTITVRYVNGASTRQLWVITLNPGDTWTPDGVWDTNGNFKQSGSGGGSGTVTSVGLTMPAEFSVAGSPITTAGTLAVTKANQNANLIYAGPTSGGAAAPTFRSLVTADIPALDASKVTTGVFGQSQIAEVYKQFARVSSPTNINVASPGATIDGYSPSAGDRIFLWQQTAPKENGLWVWNAAATPLTRPTDFASGSTVFAFYGLTVYVGTGSYIGVWFWLNTAGTITIDTTGQTWTFVQIDLAVQGVVTQLAAHGAVMVNSAGGALTTLAPSTSGNVMMSNGTDWTSALPDTVRNYATRTWSYLSFQ